MVEEIFSEVGYRCEEWVGSVGCETRLGIFGTIDVPDLKMIFCIESMKRRMRCDLLIPVIDVCPVPRLADPGPQQPSPRV